MLLSIESASKSLSKGWLFLSGFNAMAMALFLKSLFSDLPASHILALSAIAACVGLAMGIYQKFRSGFGTATALTTLIYFVLVMDFMFAGGIASSAAWVAGRLELCWAAFYANAFFMALSLLGGMYREATTLEWWGKSTPDRWKSKLEKHIDYSKHQVIPTSAMTPSAGGDNWTKYGPLIIAAGSANFALLFELYGGGRNNAIFIAAPLMTGMLAYLNLKYLGPGLVRLLLLRKLEKTIGRRFVNADLEQIQELRRTFFLSRWLMKDYALPQLTQQVRTPTKWQKNRK